MHSFIIEWVSVPRVKGYWVFHQHHNCVTSMQLCSDVNLTANYESSASPLTSWCQKGIIQANLQKAMTNLHPSLSPDLHHSFGRRDGHAMRCPHQSRPIQTYSAQSLSCEYQSCFLQLQQVLHAVQQEEFGLFERFSQTPRVTSCLSLVSPSKSLH